MLTKNQGFRFFPRAFKNRDPKSSEKSSPEGYHEPQERLRRSQERPKRPQDGPKSRQERPKRRPRAARIAPKGPQESQEALRDAPGAHFGLILGGPGHHFKQLRRPFRSSRALRQTIENNLRNHWSKGLLSVWPAFGGRKRNHDEGVHAFSGQDVLLYESNWPPRRVFSHVGPQKPLVFTWFRAFHAFLRPPVAPRGQKSHENAVRNHLSKGPSRQLQDRSSQGPWLSGRFGCASTTGDPATEPLRLKRGPWSEAN